MDLGTGDSAVNRADRTPCPLGAYVLGVERVGRDRGQSRHSGYMNSSSAGVHAGGTSREGWGQAVLGWHRVGKAAQVPEQ